MSVAHRTERNGNRHFAIMIFAKQPELQRSGGDEPYAALPWEDLDRLSAALVSDLIEQACQVSIADVFLIYHPAVRPSDEFLRNFEDRVRYIELSDSTVPLNYSFLAEFTSAQPYQRLILVFENYPLLSSQLFMKTFSHLGSEEEKIVLGQTLDGDCFYLGLRSPYQGFFEEGGQDLLGKSRGMLSHVCSQNAIVCPVQPVTPLTSGYHLASLRDLIAEMDEDDPVYPRHSSTVFRFFDKKYKYRKHGQ